MISGIIVLLGLFWAVFFLFQKEKMFIVTFAATLLFILDLIEVPFISDTAVLYFYLLLFSIMFAVMMLAKK